VVAGIGLISATLFSAKPFDTFFWSGTIGTLILLVAYVLATVGCIKLVFIDKKLPIPQWQIVVPILALVMLGYTLYRNVFPYPSSGPAQWFPVVAFGWLILVTIVMFAFPGLARRLSRGMTGLDEEMAKESV
jgi:amino acid transporter